MKVPSIAVGLLLLVHIAAVGAVRVERENLDEMLLRVRFNEDGFTFRRSGGYDHIEAPGMLLISDPGIPALPWEGIHVAIPWNRRVGRIEAERVAEDALEGIYLIAPTQPPSALGSEPARWVDGRPDVYNSASPYPAEPIRNVTSGFAGETRILSFLICPFEWNPATGSLRLATQLDIRVSLLPAAHERGLGRSPGRGRPHAEPATFFVANPSDVRSFARSPAARGRNRTSALEQGYYEYVVITADSLSSCFEPLLEWKRQKGVPSRCVTREWIEANYSGSDPQEQIRNFIKDAYAVWGTCWILLGGDAEVVPARECIAMKITAGPGADPIPCDLYFGDLDGTWNADGDGRYGEVTDSVDMYPDVTVGRASVENASEAQIFVNKVLIYEKSPPADYALDAFMTGEVMWNDPYTDSGIGLDIIDAECIPPRFDPILKLYESLGNGNRETVLAAMSAGQHFLFHGGHGSGHALYVGPRDADRVENEDADTLSNGPRNFILNSIACVPAAIDFDCIAEHFLHSPAGGCVAFIGNSRAGWGCPGHSGFGYSDRFQYEFARQVFVGDVSHIGLAHDLSKIPFVPFAGGKNVYRYCEYQLLLIGDPEMPLWTDGPLPLYADCPDSLMAQGDQARIVVQDAHGTLEGACVCLLNGHDVYLVSETDAAGAAVFAVSTASPDSMLVTVTAYNHLPLQKRIPVAPGGTRLGWCSHEIVDANDGKANPGETVGLRLALGNHGDEAAYGVSSIVRAMDGKCTVIDSAAVFGEILPGAEVWSDDTLSIELAGGLANGDVAVLQVETTDDSPRSWSSCLPVLVATSLARVSSHGVEEMTGDHDLIVEAGENVLLTLEISNSGLTVAPGTEAFISTLDPYLSVRDSVSLAGDIEGGEGGFSLHVVEVSAMCPEPYAGLIEVDLRVSGAHSATDTVWLTIGALGFSDDCESGEGGWSHTGSPDLWHLSPYRSHSGSHSWYSGGEVSRRYPSNAEAALTSQSIIAGEASTLSFWVWYEVSTYGVDGVFVIVYQNGEPDTLDFIGSGGALTTGPWDTLVTQSDWVEWERKLDDIIPGDTLMVEFDFVSDGDTVAEGIYIDDISLSARAPVLTGVGRQGGIDGCADIVITPNPAGGTIRLVAAPCDENTVIDIYDIRGRLVTQVLMRRGQASAMWDLRDRAGKRVAPGVYVVTIWGRPGPRPEKVVVLR